MRKRLIYNAVTYPAALGGLFLNVMGNALYSQPSPSFAVAIFPCGWLGAIGFSQSLAGGAVCLLLMLLVYASGGAGGGDVKLAAVLGIFLGIPWAIFVLMLTFLTAAATILPLRVWNSGWRGLWLTGSGDSGFSHPKPSHSVPLGLFYAIAFFLFLGGNRWF